MEKYISPELEITELEKTDVIMASGSLEEVAEVMEVTNDPIEAEKEIGDLLLAVTSLARMLHVNAEEALFHATNRFIDRFEAIEKAVEERGLDITAADRDELERIWDENKKKTL